MSAITALSKQLIVYNQEPVDSNTYTDQKNEIANLVQKIVSNPPENSSEEEVITLREKLYILSSDLAEKVDRVLRRIAQPELNHDSKVYKAIHQKGWKNYWNAYEQFVNLFYHQEQNAPFLHSIDELLLSLEESSRTMLYQIIQKASKYNRKALFDYIASSLSSPETAIDLLQTIATMTEEEQMSLEPPPLSEPIHVNIQPPENTPTAVFTQKHGPAKLLNNMDVEEAKQAVLSVIQSLEQDPLLKKCLNAWHLLEQQKPEFADLPLVDILYSWLKEGTCFGQSMKILELLSSHDHAIITEDWLYERLNLESFLRYQTLNFLQFVFRKQTSAYTFGVSTIEALKKILSYFPSHKRIGLPSEKMKFADFDKDVVIGSFSDFIKNNDRLNEFIDKNHYSLILVEFASNNKVEGHVTTIYCNPQQNQYFWYDSSWTKGGLFSAPNIKFFFNCVAYWLSSYKNDPNYADYLFCFTAYELLDRV